MGERERRRVEGTKRRDDKKPSYERRKHIHGGVASMKVPFPPLAIEIINMEMYSKMHKNTSLPGFEPTPSQEIQKGKPRLGLQPQEIPPLCSCFEYRDTSVIGWPHSMTRCYYRCTYVLVFVGMKGVIGVFEVECGCVVYL